MSKSYLVIDLEFTHYRRPVGKPRGFFSEIIEIGALKIDPLTLETTHTLQDFVKPHFYPKQAKEVMEFCSITAADMQTAVTFIEMLDKIKAIYTPGETYIVAWGSEDYNVIERGCQRHNVPNPILKDDYLDIAHCYRILNDDSHTTSLKDAAEELDITHEGHNHAALDDAAKTAKVLIKLLENGFTPEIAKLHSSYHRRKNNTPINKISKNVQTFCKFTLQNCI